MAPIDKATLTNADQFTNGAIYSRKNGLFLYYKDIN